ncbi:hypothetical protein GJAV_G00111070 [Gymnothorax javanicus]|nr:hypothetical protein GJAV_G00111070 [Gymnothorax javanicus]
MVYLPLFSAETWTLLVIAVCLFITYGYWPYGIFKKLGIPGPSPSPFFGSVFHYAKGFVEMDMDLFKIYGRLWGLYEARQPVLYTLDTRMIKTILVKESFSYFMDRRDFPFNGPLSDAFSIARGEKWKQKRSLISPMFSSGHIKQMFSICKIHADKLVQCLKEISNLEALDIREYLSSYCLDAVANVSMNIDTDSLNNPNDPSVVKIKKAFTFDMNNPLFLLSAVFPFLNPLLEKAGLCIFPVPELKFIISVVNKVKSDQEKFVDKNAMNFLKLMSKLELPKEKCDKNENQLKGLTRSEILSTSAMFLAAGHETTTKSILFLVYNLATNPNVMKKLQDEIDAVFPDKASVTYEQLVQIEYLDMVLNESMRRYPIALRVERFCTETVVVNGVTIPKGFVVVIPVYALHHDSEYWPEPECFDPERFSQENKARIDPYAFLPFGAGPRNCIGMRFALILMKLAIVRVLQNFSLAICPETEIPLKLDKSPILGPLNPIKVKLVPRGPAVREE